MLIKAGVDISTMNRESVYDIRRRKGHFAELLVLAKLIKQGFNIAIPYGPQKGWDLLVLMNGKWEKWQVKSGKRHKSHHKSIGINLTRAYYIKDGRHIQKEYTIEDFEVLIAVDLDSGRMFKLSFSDIEGKKGVSLMPNSELLWGDVDISQFMLI